MILAVIAVAGPLLGGFVTWWAQSRIEANRQQAERLRSERIKLYTDLLEPFIAMFSGGDPKLQEKSAARILSPDFRKLMYRVMLMGSDDVVSAINAMWTQFYANSDDGVTDHEAIESMRCIAEALLAVRRELGDRKTKLQWPDMLRARITDLDEHLAEHGY